MRKLRVQLECSRSPLSGYISSTFVRLLQPLSHPANEDAFEFYMGDGHLRPGTDIVIVERLWRQEGNIQNAVALIEQTRRAGAGLIYTSDDNLLDWPGGTIPQRSATGLFVREADGAILSTLALRDRLQELNSNIHIVPNAVDERLFLPAVKRRRKFARAGERQKIGYMGTVTHDSDLMLIADALRSVFRRRQNKIELQLIGAVGKESTFKALEGLPVRILPVKRRQEEYPRFVAWMIKNMHFDLGIAPLQDNIFTRSKSDLKFLDYGALGIPGIFSRISVYAETVKHGITGYLAENTVEAWEDGLERMLDDHALRQSIAANVQQYVFQERSLQQRAQDWRNAIHQIYEQRASQVKSFRAAGTSPGASPHRDPGSAATHAVADVDLIVGVNNQPLLAANCIESLLAHTTYPRWRLLIIDDHSDDITQKMLRGYAARYANVAYYRNDAKLGAIGVYNRGIALSDAKYIAMIHPDVVVSPRWLEKLVAVAESDPSVALVNPLSNHSASDPLPIAPGMSYLAMNEMLERETDGKAFDIVPATGDCLLVRREALERHGTLDAVFGQGSCDDEDLHMRLTSNGWRAVAAPNVYVCRFGVNVLNSKSRHDSMQKNLAVFRERWGAQYDLDLRRFQDAAAMNAIHALFAKEFLRKQSPAPSTIQRRVSRLLDVCKRVPGCAYRNYHKIPKALLHPGYTVSVLKTRLRSPMTPNNITPASAPPKQAEKPKLTQGYFNQHTHPQAPSVVFVFQGISGYGGCMSALKVVNQLIMLGVEARVAAVQHGPVDSKLLHEILFAPMLFKDSDELVGNFPSCHVAVATFWETAPWVQKIVEAGKAETSAYDLQDFEAWFYEGEEERRKVYESYAMVEHPIATSHWLRDLVRKHGADPKVIPHGFDPFRFYPRAKQEHTNLRIIAMARPETPRRGFENMVEAFRLIHQERPHVEFMLYGTENLSQLYGDLGFPYFDLGVIRDTDELCKHYNQCDIFVDPSHYQGFGQPALESMACRLACVLTNVGGVHEYAKDGVNCLLIPPRDPQACCNAVLQLLDDPELRLRLATNGRRTVEQMPMREEGRAWADFLAEISPGFREAYSRQEQRQAAA